MIKFAKRPKGELEFPPHTAKRRNPFEEGDSRIKSVMFDILILIIGAFCQAFAYSVFIAPAEIIPGGVYGISIAVNYLSRGAFGFVDGFPIGTFSLFINVPLFLLAARKLGWLSGGKTVATFVLIALFTDNIPRFIPVNLPLVDGDPFLAAVYGGAILGLGVFLTFRVGSTSAGTDVLARVISRGTNIKTSKMIIVIDSLVVLFGLIVIGDIKVPLYSLVTIFVYGKTLDLLNPENPNKAVFIVCDQPDSMRDTIIEKLRLRATKLHGQGMYAGKEKDIIFMIVERKDVAKLKKEILAIDPNAFIATTNATNDTLPPLI